MSENNLNTEQLTEAENPAKIKPESTEAAEASEIAEAAAAEHESSPEQLQPLSSDPTAKSEETADPTARYKEAVDSKAISANRSKKKSPLVAIVTTVLASAAVVGGLFAAKSFFAPKPKEIVLQAFAATVSEQKALSDKAYQIIPAAERLFMPTAAKPAETDFNFTLRSVEGIDYAQLISAMIADSGISGTTRFDPENATGSLELAVNLKSRPLISAEMFLSPQLITASVPELSDKVLSIVPQYLASDYQNSILGKIAPADPNELEAAQQLILSEFDRMKFQSTVSCQRIASDAAAIFAKALTNAAYSYDRNSKCYIITLPAEDVKAAVCEYLRYIFLHSEAEKSLLPLIRAYGTADSAADINDILADIEQKIPPLKTVISLEIEKGVIKNADISATPTAFDGKSPIDSPIIAEIVFNEKGSDSTLSFNLDDLSSGDETNFTVTTSNLFENDICSLTVNIDIDSANESFSIPIALTMSADKSCGLTFALDFSSPDNNVSLNFVANGTLSLENEVFSINIPASRVEFAADNGSESQSKALVFDFRKTVSPLSESISAPKKHIELFSLNEESLQAIIDEYSANSQNLLGRLMGFFM